MRDKESKQLGQNAQGILSIYDIMDKGVSFLRKVLLWCCVGGGGGGGVETNVWFINRVDN